MSSYTKTADASASLELVKYMKEIRGGYFKVRPHKEHNAAVLPTGKAVFLCLGKEETKMHIILHNVSKLLPRYDTMSFYANTTNASASLDFLMYLKESRRGILEVRPHVEHTSAMISHEQAAFLCLGEDGNKIHIILHDYSTDLFKKLSSELGLVEIPSVDGNVIGSQENSSYRLQALRDDFRDSAASPPHRPLIFTPFQSLLRIIGQKTKADKVGIAGPSSLRKASILPNNPPADSPSFSSGGWRENETVLDVEGLLTSQAPLKRLFPSVSSLSKISVLSDSGPEGLVFLENLQKTLTNSEDCNEEDNYKQAEILISPTALLYDQFTKKKDD